MKTTKIISHSTKWNALYKNANIDAMDIVYPIRITIYSSCNQLQDAVDVQGNIQLFDFIGMLPNDTIAALAYPILMTDAAGNYVVVRSDIQLESFLDITFGNDALLGRNQAQSHNIGKWWPEIPFPAENNEHKY